MGLKDGFFFVGTCACNTLMTKEKIQASQKVRDKDPIQRDREGRTVEIMMAMILYIGLIDFHQMLESYKQSWMLDVG